MASEEMRARIRQQHISGNLLPFVGVYFLSLCTLSSRLHADLLHQIAPTHHSSTGHCSRPAAAPQTAAPLSADHEGTTGPLCCDLQRTHKATRTLLVQTNLSPLLVLTPLLLDADTLARGVIQLHPIRTLHSSNPPPQRFGERQTSEPLLHRRTLDMTLCAGR